MKFSRANLLEIIMLAERDFSYEDISARLDCARKSIYNWLAESRAHADAGSGAASPYWIVERQNHFHILMAAARTVDPRTLPPMPLDPEEAFAERARLDDEAEKIIENVIVERSLVVNADELRTDIAELRAFAREWANKPKRAGTAKVWGRHVPGDPPERITGPRPEPPPMSLAEREWTHPRAHLSVNADLRKPDPPPPAWAKPAPSLNAATIGAATMPPETGRFSMSRLNGTYREVSRAEARANTVSLSEHGIKRW